MQVVPLPRAVMSRLAESAIHHWIIMTYGQHLQEIVNTW